MHTKINKKMHKKTEYISENTINKQNKVMQQSHATNHAKPCNKSCNVRQKTNPITWKDERNVQRFSLLSTLWWYSSVT
jgi:hypothetical protein